MSSLVLDTNIRDWVLLPLIVIMVLVSVLRTTLQVLLKDNKPPDVRQLAMRNTLARSNRLRGNGGYIAPSAFAMRKAALIDASDGALTKKDLPAAAASGMGNPMAMIDGMKGNVVYMGTNMGMIGFVSTFFSGFLLVRVPFGLTMRFKGMTQRAIDLSSLSASYISSFSFYFIVMFGLQKIMALFQGAPGGGVSDEERMMQMQMGMVGGGAQAFDAKKAFASERDMVELAKQRCVLRPAEKALVAAYKEGVPPGRAIRDVKPKK